MSAFWNEGEWKEWEFLKVHFFFFVSDMMRKEGAMFFCMGYGRKNMDI